VSTDTTSLPSGDNPFFLRPVVCVLATRFGVPIGANGVMVHRMLRGQEGAICSKPK
jgi:hypothetical protein